MRFIALTVIMLIILSSVAAATVSLDISGYNSQDSMSVSLDGMNLNYDGAFVLEPDSILYGNGGSSNSPDCSYSLEMTFNDNSIKSGARTDSGNFVWSAMMATSAGDQNNPSKIMALQAAHSVDNGALDSQFANDQMDVSEIVNTNCAKYSESISITKDILQAKGQGTTSLRNLQQPQVSEPTDLQFTDPSIYMSSNYNYKEAGPGSPNTDYANSPSSGGQKDAGSNSGSSKLAQNLVLVDPGFTHQLNIKGEKNWGQITTAVTGDVLATWKFGVDSGPNGYNFGLGSEGASNAGAKELMMSAEGSNIPTQSLPPAEVKVDVKSATEEDISNYERYVNEQKGMFYEEYPYVDTYAEPSAWYYSDLNVFVNPILEDDSSKYGENVVLEYFKMSMGFIVDGK